MRANGVPHQVSAADPAADSRRSFALTSIIAHCRPLPIFDLTPFPAVASTSLTASPSTSLPSLLSMSLLAHSPISLPSIPPASLPSIPSTSLPHSHLLTSPLLVHANLSHFVSADISPFRLTNVSPHLLSPRHLCFSSLSRPPVDIASASQALHSFESVHLPPSFPHSYRLRISGFPYDRHLSLLHDLFPSPLTTSTLIDVFIARY
ncbi:hypothetical protein FB451DRAFT_1409769 [Mycena latifolia]|nr:hypothetical protein FB451DRAFT_1409769 [Mycena latifolia]